MIIVAGTVVGKLAGSCWNLVRYGAGEMVGILARQRLCCQNGHGERDAMPLEKLQNSHSATGRSTGKEAWYLGTIIRTGHGAVGMSTKIGEILLNDHRNDARIVKL